MNTPAGVVLCPVEPLPNQLDDHVQSWDMAFKQTDAGSYVVGQVWGRAGANVYLRDQVRARLDFPATVQAVEQLSRQWPMTSAKYVEDAANGPAVLATLQARVPGLIAVTVDRSKAARANAVAPYVEAGNVYLPHPRLAPWVEGLIEECAALPNGAHDDQADALTQAVDRLLKGMSTGDVDAIWRKAMDWTSSG